MPTVKEQNRCLIGVLADNRENIGIQMSHFLSLLEGRVPAPMEVHRKNMGFAG